MRRVIWQVATVVDASPGRVSLAFDPLSTCTRCLKGEGCGSGVFARLFSRRQTFMTLGRHDDFSIGQPLRVGIEASHLVYAALLIYGLPVVAFILGALIGNNLVDEGPGADLAALIVGLILGGMVLAVFRRRSLSGLNPRLEPLSCNSSGCDS